MFNELTGTAYGIIAFTVIIVIGSVVIFNLGNSVGGTANTTAVYLLGQLGSSGLSGYTPAIIAITVGVLFLAYFGFGKGRK